MSSATASTTLTACAATVAIAAPAASMPDRDQKEVARDVDDAGHQHEDERRAAVAKPAEDGGEQVVGNDEENAAAADARIARCEVNGLLGRLHQHGNGPRKAHEQNEYPDGQDREHDRRAAE